MKIKFFILLLSLNLALLHAQEQPSGLSQEQTMLVVKKLMDYFDQYENGAPESLKKAKFNEYVDEVNPNLSQSDREKSYAIVNAYISASKGQKTNFQLSEEQSNEIVQMFDQAEKQKEAGMQAMMGKLNQIKSMSYPEYKNYVTQDGQITLPESEIQKSFNQLHQNDGKQVKVVQESKSNKIDNPVVAIDIINNPDKHTYQEFKAALKFLKPDLSDEQIRKLWEQKPTN